MRGSSSFLGVVAGVVLGVALTSLIAVGVAAQSVPTDRFSVNHFVPAIGAGNYVQVDGASVGGHMAPTIDIVVDYAHRPFVLYAAECAGGNTEDCELSNSDVEIVKYQLITTIAGTLSLASRVQLGLSVPLVLTSGDRFAASVSGRDVPYIYVPGGEAFGLGDPRLSVKFKLAGGATGLQLGALIFGTAPVGELMAEGYGLGYDGVTAGGHLIAEIKAGKFRIAVNAGGIYRPERTLLATRVGSEFAYGAALGLDVTTLLGLVTEVAGSTRFTRELDENPFEWRLAAKLTQSDFMFQLGGGAGVVSGAGIPNFRVVAGASYQPSGVDTDGDGVPDKIDSCVSEPEDLDGYLDGDGCPDADNDGDGIDDDRDKCADQAEDMDKHEDGDGCPDRDNDGDGIQDGYDSCPNEPEDMDGDRDQDGCPDNDRDRDGVEDEKDKCPDEPEDTDGYGDEDGCPEIDFDGDSIPDDQDQCPDQREAVNGFEDEDGCTDTPPPPSATPARKPRG
jgi:OOP family OmpA-OmpF porin